MKHPILKENSKRLKRFLSPFDLLTGDPYDPDRFLLNVHGIKKIYLPSKMKAIPFIKILIAKGALSKFIRSQFFKDNFHSVAHFHKIFLTSRLKYDFPFWIYHNCNINLNLKEHISLLRHLQKIRWKNKGIRLIIRKNPRHNISTLINLFIIWHKEFSKPSLNVMTISNSAKNMKLHREFFLNSKEVSLSPSFNFNKTESAASLYSPKTDSRFWFGTLSNPDFPRGRSFSYLLLHDVNCWKNKGNENIGKVIRASFPVVPDDPDSVIILTTDPFIRKSFIGKEWLAASSEQSPFKTIKLPWHECRNKIYRFDFPDDKIKFHKNLIHYRNRRKFPHFPNVDARYLHSLWFKGLPLEVIHWYVTESLYYKSAHQFLQQIPV